MSHDQRKIDQALLAVESYYLRNATMAQIARRLQISRSSVSRLITFAREAGLVEIRILPPPSDSDDLQDALASRYGIRAHIVHVAPDSPPTARHRSTAAHAVRVLNTVFDSDRTLTLSWGTMVREISTMLVPKPTSNSHVVQLNGTGNPRGVGPHFSAAILDAFAAAYNVYVREMPVPIFFDVASTREALFRESSVREVVRLQQDADIALFSLGTVSNGIPSAPYRVGYRLTEADFDGLRRDGAVADLATTFIRADGASKPIEMNARTSGPDLDTFRSIPYRICAISGDNKVNALVAALNGDLITDLVIDDKTARVLLSTVS